MSELLILAARQIDLPSFYDDLGAPGRYGGRKTGERKAPNFNRPKMVVEAMARLSVEKFGSDEDYKEMPRRRSSRLLGVRDFFGDGR
ncbi:MAG: hypothetical protein IPL15_23850 [Comamonadaceae bacterium]|uniref:hypothetical protein n=1 Tax=Candidatus Skiveiella danica TaxID=3386177 RepID=UPI00390C2DDB|nr:hypothetical protein [Comamonadaceae bacterium]